ncbi:MAG: hypothetical protein MUD05_04705 [Candidatus Nanopelagicales bacterium]|nr:hypothetical protein [Candidatus Nanopelagicales bacterium]
MIWKRSKLYRLWVVGGLAAIVFIVVRVGINTKPGDDPPYVTFGIAVGVYLLGIIIMQAIGLARTNPTPEVAPTPSGHLPTTTEGMQAMLTLPGADGERSRSGARRAHKQSIGLFIPTALIAILLPLGGYLYVSGTVTEVWQPFGETGIGVPVAALPGLAMVLVMALMLPANLKRGRAAVDDINSGLGLKISAMPKSILLPRIGTEGIGHHVVGPTTMEGIRYGRPVTVDAYSGSTAVLVGAATTPFQLRAKDGAMAPDGTVPAWVNQVLATVPSDPRWHKVQLNAGPQGIRVDRKGSALDSDWMLDLWLAERLADAAQPGR